MLLDKENLTPDQTKERLRSIGASYLADKSTKVAKVYMADAGYWVRVMASQSPGRYRVEYHNACPCGLGG